MDKFRIFAAKLVYYVSGFHTNYSFYRQTENHKCSVNINSKLFVLSNFGVRWLSQPQFVNKEASIINGI
jgi:hypothetical protein